MTRLSRKNGCLVSILPFTLGMATIWLALKLSENGHDYPALLYIGFFVAVAGGAWISSIVWDFLRRKFGLKDSTRR